MAFISTSTWALELAPGKQYNLGVERDFRITNAALGDELKDDAGRSVVKLVIHQTLGADSDDEDDGKPVNSVLCVLRAGNIEQTKLDVTFVVGQQLELTVSGKNSIFLLGNYILQEPNDQPPFGDDYDDLSDEDAYRLEDVSSDVEMDATDLAGLDEDDSDDAVPTEAEGKKRKRESDADADEETPDLSKLTKNQRKKLAKKLKGDDGDAVPVGEVRCLPCFVVAPCFLSPRPGTRLAALTRSSHLRCSLATPFFLLRAPSRVRAVPVDEVRLLHHLFLVAHATSTPYHLRFLSPPLHHRLLAAPSLPLPLPLFSACYPLSSVPFSLVPCRALALAFTRKLAMLGTVSTKHRRLHIHSPPHAPSFKTSAHMACRMAVRLRLCRLGCHML